MDNIFNKRLENITSSDIINLISIKYDERQGIEYKKEMYGRNDNEKKEMLRDISSIANAYGGYLIIGIEEDGSGFPIRPINIADVELERERIEQSCLSSIEPRIAGLKARAIKLASGEDIIIVSIPRSTKKPHMVTFSGLNQFWMRHINRKLPMTVEEIRDACTSTGNIWKDLRQFLKERELEIKEENGTNSFLILGSSPIHITDDLINMREPKIFDFLIKPPDCTNENYGLSFKLVGTGDASPEPTLSGLKISVPGWASVELNRNGYYEVRIPIDMFAYQKEGKRLIHKKQIINIVVNYFRALASLADILGVDQDNVAYMSFFNLESLTLEYGRKGISRPVFSEWSKTMLKIPPKQIFSLDNPDKEAKYFLDKLWNAFGFWEAPYFKDDKYSPS
jgi:hypothetical protein